MHFRLKERQHIPETKSGCDPMKRPRQQCSLVPRERVVHSARITLSSMSGVGSVQAIMLISCFLYIFCLAVVPVQGQHTTLTDAQGSFNYSLVSETDTSEPTWTIDVPNASKLLLTFVSLKMYSAEVQINEANTLGVSAIFFKCPSCGDNIPPTFESTRSTITVRAFGVVDGSTPDPSSFTLAYVAVLDAHVPALDTVTFLYNMGYSHVSPLTLTDGYVAAGVVQDWKIDSRDGAVSHRIQMALSDLEFGSSCTSTLTIYDDWDTSVWNQLYTGCEASDSITNWLYSNTGKVYVVFNASMETTNLETNFKLTYLGEKELFNCGSMTDNVDRLTANTAFLSDGSRPIAANNGSMRPSMACDWLIQPTNGGDNTFITLIFNRVSIKQGGRVVVYDNYNASGLILWDSGQQYYQGGYQGRSITTPPPIISSAKAMYVVFTADSNDDESYHGFYGEYFLDKSASMGMGSRKSLLMMSSAIDIGLPGAGLSGNFYPKSFSYVYHIKPDNLLSGEKLMFIVNKLFLQQKHGDSMTIYDGADPANDPVLVKLQGSTVPTQWFEASGSEASMVFTSDADEGIGGGNFGYVNINYFADGPSYHCGFTRNPARFESPAMLFSDGSESTGSLYQGQDCQWVVEPLDSIGIYLYFTYFEVQGGELVIYNDEYNPDWTYHELMAAKVATIKNTMAVPAPMFLPYQKIGFKYETEEDPVPTGKGFRGYYYRQSSDRSVPSVPGDGIIRIHSSSVQHLGNNELWGYIDPTLNLTYSIESISAEDPYIYFAFSSMNLTGCHAKVSIYDGPDTNSALLGEYCGQDLPETPWIQTTSNTATVTFHSTGQTNYVGDFSLAYYSNGPNSHCGFHVNPGYLKHRSFVFTDGSAESENLYPDQNCAWIINPDQTEDGVNTGFLVLEFLYSDLRGGSIEVYTGLLKEERNLLWKCVDCQVKPKPLVSDTGYFYVYYVSGDSEQSNNGKGFKAMYWSTNTTVAEELFRAQKTDGFVLEMPPEMQLDATSRDNTTLAWHLGLTQDNWNELSYFPRVISSAAGPMHLEKVRDGRRSTDTADYQVFSTNSLMCGMVRGNGTNLLRDSDTFGMRASQYAGAYIESSASGKVVHDSYGTLNTNLVNSASAQYVPAADCKYIMDSGSSQSISIKGAFSSPNDVSRLLIYGGKYGNDDIIFDSWHVNYTNAVLAEGIKAPCGRATILLFHNSSVSSNIQQGLNLEYMANPLDTTEDCAAYYFSLLPVVIIVDPWIPYYIALGTCFGMCLSFLLGLYIRKLSHKYYPENGCNPFKRIRIYKIVTPRHLSYTPKFDAFRNKFLPHGECAICQDNTRVFSLKPCNHKLCEEDMAGYLGAALGDISLFPVKCPLHHEGCTSTIDAKIAKRVLGKNSFDKFNEFSDRAKYGEGMRCIFCNNYVNFPEEGAFSMVECPYCVQTFCIRCKKPWHFGSKCPLDNVDDSLDLWKHSSGAQTCPACSKLIEKSDVETCNHMIHKITDGIPCIKDRTDFCYCCGEEVMPEYPHDEVSRPGVNHFPDGVYQKCLSMIKKERDAERDRLKRLRRMKEKPGGGMKRREKSFGGLEIAENGRVATDDDGWEKIPDYLLTEADEEDGNRGSNARLGDAFDDAWDAQMASAKLTAGYENPGSGSDSDVELGRELPSESAKVSTPPVPEKPPISSTPLRGTRPKPSSSSKPKVASPTAVLPVPSRNGSSSRNNTPSPSRFVPPTGSPSPTSRRGASSTRGASEGYR